jgi:hypothetical protein
VNALEDLENFYSVSNKPAGVIESVEELVGVYQKLARRDPEKFKGLEEITQEQLSNLKAQMKQSGTIQ